MSSYTLAPSDRRELVHSVVEIIEHYSSDAESAAETVVAAIAAAPRRREDWAESPSFAFVLAFARKCDQLGEGEE